MQETRLKDYVRVVRTPHRHIPRCGGVFLNGQLADMADSHTRDATKVQCLKMTERPDSLRPQSRYETGQRFGK